LAFFIAAFISGATNVCRSAWSSGAWRVIGIRRKFGYQLAWPIDNDLRDDVKFHARAPEAIA
jgi:hypothetical protein